jgi:hypothetical protein
MVTTPGVAAGCGRAGLAGADIAIVMGVAFDCNGAGRPPFRGAANGPGRVE